MKNVKFDEERRFFNKWEMHKLLSGEETLCHLPETKICSPSTVEPMLRRHRRVYIKPLDAWGGIGISRVLETRQADGRARFTAVHSSGERTVYPSMDSVVTAILQRYKGKPSIIQQSAPLVGYRGCPFDVRVLMQRDTGDEWTYAGMLARVGGQGSIVSNVGTSGGTVRTVGTVLTGCYPEHVRKQRIIRGGLKQCGYAVTRVLDRYYSFEEVGLDVGLDSKGEPWLLEVNTNDAVGGPSHELFAQLPNSSLYRQITARAEARRKSDAAALLGALFGLSEG